LPIVPYDQTIIISENDPQMRGLLRSLLMQRGRIVLLCNDGLEAVALASQTLATLVLLDLRMPRLDGIQACRQIRGLPRYDSVPIVILTVFDGEAMERRAIRAGASLVLAKPISRLELLRGIDPLIQAQIRKLELKPGSPRGANHAIC
jgi:two-component system, OmpR family, alkaline phosphatase synthesis response regulator PhoP